MQVKAFAISGKPSGQELPPLFETRIDVADPRGHDLRVRVEAIAVNPVDLKRRQSAPSRGHELEILGWDAAGVVEAVGESVSLFRPGDRVFYAGDISRDGSYSELQLVDERIVAARPSRLTPAEAAALPLTALTAYEGIFERLGASPFNQRGEQSLLVIGGAGGVGSMAIQLARLAGLRVTATASRPESADWCRALGADAVIDHRDLVASARENGRTEFDFVYNTQDTVAYWDAACELVKPEGRIVSIVEAPQPVDVGKLMQKSASFGYELMFTKPLYRRANLVEQHHILTKVARLVDQGVLRTTAARAVGTIGAENLETAHEQQASRRMIGKLVLAGW